MLECKKITERKVDKMTYTMLDTMLDTVWGMVQDTSKNNSRSVVLSAFLC